MVFESTLSLKEGDFESKFDVTGIDVFLLT
jgi:hypothetical protein